ncbi:MAG: prepilin-type N-terminal cleavage/methylation domain-containing protein [Gammaproteobacteria bacterium]|nr:prepilin-type N-terminal cleavage/methylation domain-containing protein [Gammaproteobacteria bacterium]
MRGFDNLSNASCVRRSRGVSMIELIIVITISGIIATILGVVLVRPIQGYEAQVRRAQLVDAAEMAVRRLGRDIRQALPNSVRVRDALGNTNNVNCSATGAVCTIEMLNTLDGARYREGPGNIGHDHGPTQYRLKVPGNDNNGFNIVGEFQNFRPTLPFTSTSERLAIYNQSATGATSAYADATLAAGPYVITNPNAPANTKFMLQDDGGGDEWRITPSGNPNFNFRWASPNQRIFIVDTPVSYGERQHHALLELFHYRRPTERAGRRHQRLALNAGHGLQLQLLAGHEPARRARDARHYHRR